MHIIYLLRCAGTGHSIEGLFEVVRRMSSDQFGVYTETITLPFVSRSGWSIWRNSRLVRKLKADVFHITGDIHYAALLLPASRTVLTIHDCSLLQNNRKRPLRYLVFWLIWYYLPIRRAQTVTAISEKTRQELLRLVGKVAQKVVVVANGYDPAFTYQPALFRKAKPMLLQLGTAPNKNVQRLIDALVGVSCTLTVVGPLSASQLVALREGQIEYQHYPALSRLEVVRLYEACDIVTFLSTYEGFGLPIIEANAVGRVVLTSALNPMKKIAGVAAHLVNPLDTIAIREGIKRLIADDAYRQTLIAAGLTNAQQYTAADMAQQYLTLYRKLYLPRTFTERHENFTIG